MIDSSSSSSSSVVIYKKRSYLYCCRRCGGVGGISPKSFCLDFLTHRRQDEKSEVWLSVRKCATHKNGVHTTYCISDACVHSSCKPLVYTITLYFLMDKQWANSIGKSYLWRFGRHDNAIILWRVSTGRTRSKPCVVLPSRAFLVFLKVHASQTRLFQRPWTRINPFGTMVLSSYGNNDLCVSPGGSQAQKVFSTS